MVNTRSRIQSSPEGQSVTESTADRPNETVTVVPPLPPLLNGRVEQIPRTNIATVDPFLTEVTPQTQLMDIMRAMKETMAKRQELFMKLLEDRETRQLGKECSYNSFLCCKLPELSGTDEPVKCMNWLKEIEQAFRACDCDEGQKVKYGSQMLRVSALTWWNVFTTTIEESVLSKMAWTEFKRKLLEEYCNEEEMDLIEEKFRSIKKGDLSVKEYTRLFMEKLNLVRHVVSTEKVKVKAYLKGLPANMLSMVRKSKASNLHETIEKAKVMERLYARDKEEKMKIVGKRRWESPPSSYKKPRFQPGSKSFDNLQVANGERVVLWDILRECCQEISGEPFMMDLLPMPIGSFDVVVGMDWLAKHQAEILCSKKLIWIPVRDSDFIFVYGEKRKAFVVDAKAEKKKMEDVKIVNEFPDVFPDDLPGLPPDRQVEFRIDLILVEVPISCAPYRLVPTEVQKMMTQLQELLEKGYVKPSSSSGSSGTLCEEERRVDAYVHRLPRFEQGDHKEQIPVTPN
ncbi:hypothetical protein L6452_22288 [Arctium lappa]|uniref:Uncharacterized protein n=1 Tax=Arctium lappa TaxID=4217 RepID=A0ACB9AYZ7_ARCLA|nr:hypothetical protein L6452_22288 [Arctium lappa]